MSVADYIKVAGLLCLHALKTLVWFLGCWEFGKILRWMTIG